MVMSIAIIIILNPAWSAILEMADFSGKPGWSSLYPSNYLSLLLYHCLIKSLCGISAGFILSNGASRKIFGRHRYSKSNGDLISLS